MFNRYQPSEFITVFGRCFALLFLPMILVGNFSDDAQSRPLADIKESGEVRFCVVVWGPMVGTLEPADCRGENCKFEGPVRDLSMAFAETLGDDIQASFRVLDWDQQFQNAEGVTVRDGTYTPALIEDGVCDLYTSFMAEHDWRKKKLAMPAVWPGRYVIVVNKARADEFASLDDLAGKLGAIIENSTQHTALDQLNETAYADNPTQYQFVANYGEGVDAIEAGEVDYTVLGADSALWYTRNEAKNSMAVFPIGPERMNNWAMHKDYQELQAAVRDFIAQQQTTTGSALDQMFKAYTGLSYAKYLRLISHGIK